MVKKKDKKFFIIDSYSRNVGDILILTSGVKLIQKTFPNVKITIEASHPSLLKKNTYLNKFELVPRIIDIENILSEEKNILQKVLNIIVGIYDLSSTILWAFLSKFNIQLNFIIRRSKQNYLTKMKEAELVLSSGGGFLTSRYKYQLRLFTYIIAFLLGKKVVSIGHSIGPFESYLSKRLIPFFLKRFVLVQIRESWSYNYIDKFADLKNKKLTSDLVYTRKKKKLSTTKKKKKILSICIKKQEKIDEYVEIMSKIISNFREKGFKIYIISHDPLDDHVVEKIYSSLDENNKVEKVFFTYEAAETEKKFSKSRFVISNRMHAAIISAVFRVPFVCLSYQPKFIGFFQDLKYPKNLLFKEQEIYKDEAILNKMVEEMFSKRRELSNLLNTQVPILRKRAVENIKNLREVL